MNKIPHFLRNTVSVGEIYDALVTGTRPVYFQTTEDDFIWGAGTLFIAQWNNHQFAITANHVIKNLNADPKTLRIIIPGYDVALPISGATTPSHPNHQNREEVEDMIAFHIIKEPDLKGHSLAWHAWKMNYFWKPASELTVGQQLFAIGYPSDGRHFNYGDNTVSASPLIAVGKLASTSIGKNLCTIDCEEFPVDLDGISGGPVFARFDGLFYYVGMIIMGTNVAKKIHFVDSLYVTFLINEASKIRG